ncbi:uncharacterized protein [Hetaerina americana]|uniref:uncharacterized protein n=1 Tax=Hetaerina americana TaxID=62018 RepID=UPI003A7F1F92
MSGSRIQSPTLHKPDKQLIATLKIKDRKYKKWSKYRAIGISIRRSKTQTTLNDLGDVKDEESDLSDDSEGAIGKGYQIIPSTTLEARRNARVRDQQHPLHKRLTHRTRISCRLSERIKVQVPGIIVPAKTDIDPGFFSTIQGRPIVRQYKRREFLKREIELFFTRANILEVHENINDLRRQLLGKQKRLSQAEKSFPFHEKQSWNSIYKDFKITAEVHERQKETRKKLLTAHQRRKKLQDKVQIVCCNLYNLEDQWRSLKTYQGFLYRISPLPWRKKYDRIHVDENILILAQLPTVCDRYHISSIDPAQPLDELVQFFYDVTAEEEPPELFFSDPKQLKDYFNYLVELNSNILSNAMMLQEENKVLNKFFKDLKQICQQEMQKLKSEYNSFVEDFSWLEKRKNELHDLAMKEKNNVTDIILSDPHIEARALIEGAYNMLLNPTKLNVGLSSILNHLSNDVSSVLWEISNLPPPLIKRLILKKEEELYKSEVADNYYRKIKRYEKQVKDIFFRRIIPKHRKGLRPRSQPPTELAKEEEKLEVKLETNLYTEDIFTLPLVKKDIGEDITEEHEIQLLESEPSLRETVEELEESDEMSKMSETTYLKQPSTPKSQESIQSSMGLDDEMKYSKDGLGSLIPNKTVDLPPIEPKFHPAKYHSWPIKKPSLVVTDMTKRKISLLTNYDKSFSAAETDIDAKEMTFVDVVKTTKIRDNLMRWKSIFPTEKEKISKSSLFHVGKTTSPDPYLCSVQQKIKHTSRTRFDLKSDVIGVSPLIHSSYIPSLPTITESETSDKPIPNPIDSIIPMLDSKLRECKMRYYYHKVSREDKQMKKFQ